MQDTHNSQLKHDYDSGRVMFILKIFYPRIDELGRYNGYIYIDGVMDQETSAPVNIGRIYMEVWGDRDRGPLLELSLYRSNVYGTTTISLTENLGNGHARKLNINTVWWRSDELTGVVSTIIRMLGIGREHWSIDNGYVVEVSVDRDRFMEIAELLKKTASSYALKGVNTI